MPCYEPPPFSDSPEVRASEQKAVQLLCELIGAQVEAGALTPPKYLEWFIKHRELDARMAEHPDWGNNPKSQEAQAARNDVANAKAMLKPRNGA